MSGLFGGNSSAGGGGTAINAYADQSTLMHRIWLTGSALEPVISEDPAPLPATTLNVANEMITASTHSGGLSPYAMTTAYDPDAELSAIEAKIADFVSDIEGLDPTVDIGNALEFAINQLAEQLITDSDVNAAVDAFETRQGGAFARAATRLAAGMFDIGAVMNSSFTMAMSNLENDRQAELNDFDLKLRLEMKNQKLQTIMSLAQEWLQQQHQKLAMRQTVAAMQDALSRLTITAKNDETGFDLQMLVKDRQWNLDLFTYGNNVMSSIAGSATVPHPTQWERKLDAATSLVGTWNQSRSVNQSAFRLGADYIGAFRGAGNNTLSAIAGLFGAAAAF